jgi:hypothetical protein
MKTTTIFVNVPNNQVKDFLTCITKMFPEASYFGPEEHDVTADTKIDYTKLDALITEFGFEPIQLYMARETVEANQDRDGIDYLTDCIGLGCLPYTRSFCAEIIQDWDDEDIEILKESLRKE